MHLIIATHITSVNILAHTGVYHRVVKRGVEHFAFFVSAALHGYAPQLFIPLVNGGTVHLVERAVCYLGIKIKTSAIYINIRKAYRHLNTLAI